MTEPPRVVVGMMQRDEDTRLEAWILYHAHLFGFDALHIFDNGSVSPVTLEVLRKYAQLGVQVDYQHTGSEGFGKKGVVIEALFRQLEADPRNEFFVPLDCDEFLALRTNGHPVGERTGILKYLASLRHDPRILISRDAYPNILGRPGFFMEPYAHGKMFFTEGCVEGLGEGFHNGNSRKSSGTYVTDVVYLHLHYRPHADMVLQSTRKLAQFTDMSDLRALYEYKGTSSHVAKYVTMGAEEYANQFKALQGAAVPWFVPHCERLGIGREFFEAI
jgi:hypothetical protein